MTKSYREAIRLIAHYRWKSIFFKYVKRIMMIISVPCCLIGCLILAYYHTTASQQADEWLNTTISKAAEMSNSMFEDIERSYGFLASNSYTSVFLTSPRNASYNFGGSNTANRIMEQMETLIVSSSFIDSIYLYSTLNGYVLSSRNSNYIENFSDRSWYNTYIATGQPKFVQSSTVYNGKEAHPVLQICYGIYINNTLYGITVFNLDMVDLENTLLSGGPPLECVAFLDNAGNLVYQSNTKKCTILTQKDRTQCANTQFSKFKRAGKTVMTQPLGYYDLQVVTINDMKHWNQFPNTALMVLLLLFMALVLPFGLSLYLSIQFYDSIAELMKHLQEIDNSAIPDDNNEIVHISQSILSLIYTNQRREYELVEKNTALKKAQTLAMQNQINPHFVFNTLNLVNMIIMNILHRENDAERVISDLCDMLYYAFKSDDHTTTVREEIKHIKKYIDIERIKHKNSFDVEWDVEEEILDAKIIKLILQPLVENAFEHGISPLQGRRGVITVSGYLANHDLVLSIQDNGIGISADKLLQIQQELLSNDPPSSRHIGLGNVNQRIRLIYGDPYGVSLQSGPEGTTVTLLMPYQD